MPKELKTNMISAAAEKAQLAYLFCFGSCVDPAWQLSCSKGSASSIAERSYVWLVFVFVLT